MDCFNVADYFLIRARAEDSDEGMTHLKLQKLVYYAQGFHLAIYDKPLFPNSIYAWQHGPVVRELWDKYCGCGSSALDPPDTFDFKRFPEEQIELLDEVFEVYGQFTAWKLRNLTHEEPPWKSVDINDMISIESMKEYFRTQLSE